MVHAEVDVSKLKWESLERKVGDYEAVIGLEVHCQLKTQTKLFCSCTVGFGASANSQVCPVCLGLPGVLPVLNAKAVDLALRIGLALGGEIQERSEFSRKQYFYPDLPKNYQITQYDRPYCLGGGLTIGGSKFVRLRRIHLEEDAGKSTHGSTTSFLDFNRAGIPLVEIVSEPDISTPQEAAEYLRLLHQIVCSLEISEGNLEEGSFRCDANVSLRKWGEDRLGTRCEIKNLNSFRNIEKAIAYELRRQSDILEEGESVVPFTLLWDAAVGRTRPLRVKEEGDDYRYFPDPDLPPLLIARERIDWTRSVLPELPEEKIRRFQDVLGLGLELARILGGDKNLARYFEECLRYSASDEKLGKQQTKVSPKLIATWLCSEFLREAALGGWDLTSPPLSCEAFVDLLGLVEKQTISGNTGKMVLQKMLQTGKSAEAIVVTDGLEQVSEEAEIVQAIATVLAQNPRERKAYQEGKAKLLSFFVGQVMKIGAGRFNPELTSDLLKRELSKPT